MQLTDRIGRRVKLQDLHVFMAVVEAGSMAKAAKVLNRGQPNVSRSITDLEHALGVPLLDRHSRGVEPTSFGRALLDGSIVAFDGLHQAFKSIEALADPAVGEVRLGCTPLLASSFVTGVIGRISQRYPRFRFSVVTGYVEALHRELTERNVDFLITRRFGSLSNEHLSFEFLFDDASVVATGAQNPWARRRKMTLSDLANEPWVLPPPETAVGSIAMQAFRACKLDYPKTAVVTDSPHARISLLATGRFFTIFPTYALKFQAGHTEIKVLPIELPTGKVPNGIVTLENRMLGPAAQLFIKEALIAARSVV
jgi:DNA-binding transcriptional LysR family regulator